MKKNTLILTFLYLLVSFTSCTSPEIQEAQESAIPVSYFEETSTSVDTSMFWAFTEKDNSNYILFRMPVSRVDLPFIWVGGVPVSGCFTTKEKADTSDAPLSLTTSEESMRQITASLTANLKHELVKAGLRASLADSVTNNISLEAKKISFIKIRPEKIEFNFAQTNCQGLIRDLMENNEIVLGVLRADSFVMGQKHSLTQKQRAELEGVIKNANNDLRATFSRISIENSSFKIVGQNLFFAYYAAGIGRKSDTKGYQVKRLKTGSVATYTGKFRANGNEYAFTVKRKDKDSLVIFFANSSNAMENTGDVSVDGNGRLMYGICGPNMLVNFKAVRDGDKDGNYKLTITAETITIKP
ncbi:MAG: hypothetical protein AB1458_09080 [Bacteroidota bacterium]